MATKPHKKKPAKKAANPKQRQYVAGRIGGKSKRQAAIDAGYAKTTAKNANQKLDKKPAVQELFQQLMADAGVTDELLAQRIFEGLHATETKFWQPKFAMLDQSQELIVRTLISFSERREMLELALKVKGLLIEKHELQAKLTLEDLLEESHGAPTGTGR